MKQIIMTTESPTPVKMGAAGEFTTGVAKSVDDDALAEALLNRPFPQFREATEADFIAAAKVEEAKTIVSAELPAKPEKGRKGATNE